MPRAPQKDSDGLSTSTAVPSKSNAACTVKPSRAGRKKTKELAAADMDSPEVAEKRKSRAAGIKPKTIEQSDEDECEDQDNTATMFDKFQRKNAAIGATEVEVTNCELSVSPGAKTFSTSSVKRPASALSIDSGVEEKMSPVRTGVDSGSDEGVSGSQNETYDLNSYDPPPEAPRGRGCGYVSWDKLGCQNKVEPKKPEDKSPSPIVSEQVEEVEVKDDSGHGDAPSVNNEVSDADDDVALARSQSSTSSDVNKLYKQPGLANLGNTCYLNSVLQSLRAIRPLLALLYQTAKTFNDTSFKPISDNMKEKVRFVLCLTDKLMLMAMYQQQHDHTYKPSVLHSALIDMYPDFDGGRQQDAHEALTVIFSAIEECMLLAQHMRLNDQALGGIGDPDPTVSAAMPRPIPLWDGQMRFVHVCELCEEESAAKQQPFVCLSAPIQTSVKQRLSMFSAGRPVKVECKADGQGDEQESADLFADCDVSTDSEPDINTLDAAGTDKRLFAWQKALVFESAAARSQWHSPVDALWPVRACDQCMKGASTERRQCECCMATAPFARKQTVTGGPELLVVQAMRFRAENGGRKVNTVYPVPLSLPCVHEDCAHYRALYAVNSYALTAQTLNAYRCSDYDRQQAVMQWAQCVQPCKQHSLVYQLKAVVIHQGVSLTSGHYFAYVLMEDDVRSMDVLSPKTWWKMNDSVSTRLSGEQELVKALISTRHTPYMLFYHAQSMPTNTK